LAFVNLSYLSELFTDYSLLAAALDIPENHKKDAIRRIIVVLGVKIDSELIEARLDSAKLIKAKKLITAILQKSRLSLHDTKSIVGFLFWCAKVIRLRRLFLHELFAFKKRFKLSSSDFKKLITSYLLRCDLAW
jgi:hypothetical protein